MQKLTVTDILGDIEFELAQGIVFQGDLGQSVQALRNYQNEVRTELLGQSHQSPNLREALARLFQVNDMLITLCQELSTELTAVRQSQRRIDLVPRPLSSSTVQDYDAEARQIPTGFPEPPALPWSLPENVREAMRRDTLHVDLEVRALKIPLIGGVVRRFRLAIHNLALFYVQQLAHKQHSVNQVYGDWIGQLLYLSQELARQLDDLYVRSDSLVVPPNEDR